MFEQSLGKDPRRENNEKRFKMCRNQYGTFGIFEDYPHSDELLQKIINQHEVFGVEQKPMPRSKVSINLDGKEVKLFAKGKLENYVIQHRARQSLFLSSSFHDFKNQRLGFSVLNELLNNRMVAKRYKERYNHTLQIETPVGFFISEQNNELGARWVIFEEIPNIIQFVPANKFDNFENKMKAFQSKISEELKQIGVSNQAPFKNDFDLVPIGDVDNPEFVLVDSEEWKLIS